MERSIPHIRDIFSPSSRKKSGDFQDLCVYEKSPRSRRRQKHFDGPNEQEQPDKTVTTTSPRKRSEKIGKENQKSKNSDEARLLPEIKNSAGGNNKQYSSKTLTDRDIRHLERHLSMKKTIRKQISRNLAQAFVDNPNLFEPDPKKDSGNQTAKQDYGKSYTKARLAKSEQAVLDMLKTSIDDRDSGHSSPTNEETDFDVGDHKAWSSEHRNSDAKLLSNDVIEQKSYPTEKKSSIWKMFSSKSKGKR